MAGIGVRLPVAPHALLVKVDLSALAVTRNRAWSLSRRAETKGNQTAIAAEAIVTPAWSLTATLRTSDAGTFSQTAQAP